MAGPYSIIAAMMPDTDNQGDMFQLLTDIYGASILAERDVTGQGANRVVGRYVLGQSIAPEITAFVWLGFGTQGNSSSPSQSVQSKINALAQFQLANAMQGLYVPPPSPITRAFVIARLKQLAYEHGCEKAWIVQPGDSLTVASAAALLAKFSALAPPF